MTKLKSNDKEIGNLIVICGFSRIFIIILFYEIAFADFLPPCQLVEGLFARRCKAQLSICLHEREGEREREEREREERERERERESLHIFCQEASGGLSENRSGFFGGAE